MPGYLMLLFAAAWLRKVCSVLRKIEMRPFQTQRIDKTIISLQKMLRPFPPLIDKKSCYSTGRAKFFIETFRALGPY